MHPNQPPHARQPYIPLLTDPADPDGPRPRQPSSELTSVVSVAGSIWAPQPQSPTTTWPDAIESISRTVTQADYLARSRNHSFPLREEAPITEEDVFGTANGVDAPRNVGAIGDGRQRSYPTPETDHAERLLRTLNLNTTHHPGPLSFDYDLSPSTSTSFPPTPLDASPDSQRGSVDLPYSPRQDINSGTSPSYPPKSPAEAGPQFLVHDDAQWDEAIAVYNTARPQNGVSRPRNRVLPFSEPPSSAHSPIHSPRSYTAEFNNQPTPRHPQVHPDWQRSTRLAADPRNFPSNLDFGTPLGISGYGNPQAFPNQHPLVHSNFSRNNQQQHHASEPINFLSLLHPGSSPDYPLFVSRIVKQSDQQASIFLQQKLKNADSKERSKIVDAICTKGYEMMAHRFGNWAVQRCLEAAATPEERKKIASCMKGRVVDLATNCYGCHVLQKALDCEEDIRLLIVAELLRCEPAKTLVNKHASHVWSKIMELSWTPPAPPIFAFVNSALHGKWASLACHETGSLVVQHAFENLEDNAKDGIVNELLNQGPGVFGEVVKNQWGSYCIQHILEHGSHKYKELTINHILHGLLEFATNEQGYKSVTKALKEGGKPVLDKFVKRMCEPPQGGRRAIVVDLALSSTGSQLIASVLPNVDKSQLTSLHDSIRGHIVTLRGCKTGSKVIWLFDRMVRANNI